MNQQDIQAAKIIEKARSEAKKYFENEKITPEQEAIRYANQVAGTLLTTFTDLQQRIFVEELIKEILKCKKEEVDKRQVECAEAQISLASFRQILQKIFS